MKNVLIFVFGAIVGATGAYFYTKHKYESLIDDEIESVKEEYKKELKGKIEEIKESLMSSEKVAPDKNEANEELAEKAKNKPAPGEIIKKQEEYKKEVVRYNDYSKDDSENFEAVVDDSLVGINGCAPIVISPDEFGEDETYDKVSLYYYSDGIIADENDEEVENVDGLIGYSSLETFGEYEDDSVHVKNDGNKTYYEILRCDKTFDGR